MEFAILGPLEVRDDGRLLTLRQGRARSLLTALLLRLGQVASADALVEEVWGEQVLADASNALQVQVSYLRRTVGLGSGVGRPALRTAGAGYLLDVEPDSLDAHRFEFLIHSAASSGPPAPLPVDAKVALDELRAALGLWRGEPLQDLPDAPSAVAETARLEELRAAALEYEIDARLALGEHELAVPALRQLIAEQPLHERLRAQLTLALYRSGRQADALREFDATRRAVEELGVDPGRELQQLHRAVLDHAPELDWRPSPARSRRSRGSRSRLPAPTSRLVGRARTRGNYEALTDNRMVTLTGPAERARPASRWPSLIPQDGPAPGVAG